MGAYLSDRLFVALAKKVGFPDKRTLTTYRSLQLEFVRSGMPVTLFTLTKLKGVLDEQQSDQFVGWARQVAACRPRYQRDLVESGSQRAIQETDGVVEVRPRWQADETIDVDSQVDNDHAIEALDPSKDHTQELLRLLDDMSVEEESSRSHRSRRVERFGSEDMLPVLGEREELDALVSGYIGGQDVLVEVVESTPALFEESQVDNLLESRVDPLEGPTHQHAESHVDLFEDDEPSLDDLFGEDDAPRSLELFEDEDASVDDCLALLTEDTRAAVQRRPAPVIERPAPVIERPAAVVPIEDMDTDVVDPQGLAEGAFLELLPEWELEDEQAAEAADSALFDVPCWDEVEDDLEALEQDAALDLDIVDPWADPPTTAAHELPLLGPTNAKASAEFVGDPESLLGSESSFDPWGASLGDVEKPMSLYDQLASDSGTRQGYQPEASAPPPPPPPLAPLPSQFAAA